jgi:hypothetical protein
LEPVSPLFPHPRPVWAEGLPPWSVWTAKAKAEAEAVA